ncbi:MAG: hypothetical protein WD708_05785 [Kiritimatiellia bacterium]
MSTDDPPIYLTYPNVPSIGHVRKDPTHTPNFGVKLKERMDEVGVECHLVHGGSATVSFPTPEDFLIHVLLQGRE